MKLLETAVQEMLNHPQVIVDYQFGDFEIEDLNDGQKIVVVQQYPEIELTIGDCWTDGRYYFDCIEGEGEPDRDIRFGTLKKLGLLHLLQNPDLEASDDYKIDRDDLRRDILNYLENEAKVISDEFDADVTLAEEELKKTNEKYNA